MFNNRRERDRRSEPRTQRGGRVYWKRADGLAGGWGLLSDGSGTGLSFVTSNLCEPKFGEEIDVAGRDLRKQRYRITRVSSYDEHLSLVACRVRP
jgi:hypothetical protein